MRWSCNFRTWKVFLNCSGNSVEETLWHNKLQKIDINYISWNPWKRQFLWMKNHCEYSKSAWYIFSFGLDLQFFHYWHGLSIHRLQWVENQFGSSISVLYIFSFRTQNAGLSFLILLEKFYGLYVLTAFSNIVKEHSPTPVIKNQ